jgi:hypothetical protein
MTTHFTKYMAACAFALAAAGMCNVATAADTTHPKAEAVLKAKAKAKKAAKKAAKEEPEVASTEPEPDVTDSVTVDYNCELGNKVTIYTNMTDSDHMALRWKKRLHQMTRVGTSTGASRFENTTFGLVWIGIPAKSMLLDSKANRQLANECKNAEQDKPLVATAAQPAAKS